jgi:DNA-binding GntR family transcriptional regulator
MAKTSSHPSTHAATDTRRADTKAKLLSMQMRKMALERGPSAKLPMARQLRDSLGTTRATLHGALGELEARNIITRKQGNGIYVPHPFP